MALIDKASLLMVPSTYEAGTLYNVLPSGNRAPDSTDQNSGYDQTRADFTFDRGSNAAATRVNADGLIEKYRENKLLQSNQFDTTWTGGGLTKTSGQLGYDESNDAWLIENISSGSRFLTQTGFGSGVATFSIYAKAGTTDWILLNNGLGGYSYFDLTNGTIGASTAIDSQINAVGATGWYRCSIAVSSANEVRYYLAVGNNSPSTAVGDNIYIQNAQLETGLVATDYLESGATTAKAGVLIDLPRINYDANGENGSLLLEPSRANLIPQSEYFGAWTLNSNGTGSDPVLDFGYTSPEGKDNAYKVTLDSGAGTTTSDESIMYLNKSGLTAGSEHTASVYLKGAVGGEEVIVRDTEGSYKKWTLTTEWARYEYTQTAAGSSYATSFGIRQGLGGIGTINSSAVVYIYGFQSELGSYKTSYIPNHGESGGVTRAADSCSVTGVSDVIGQTEGTLFAEVDWNVKPESGSPVIGILTLNNGANNLQNSILLGIERQSGGTNRVYCFVLNSNVTQAELFGSSITDGTYKIAFAYKANDFALYVNGSQIGTDTSGSVPALNEVLLGKRFGTDTFNTSDAIKQAILFNERLTNSELATLTTL